MKLTKIKLINWHLFNDTSIELRGNFLLTGENGCGKSTLTDAIYFVLSGGDDNCFNNAANADANIFNKDGERVCEYDEPNCSLMLCETICFVHKGHIVGIDLLNDKDFLESLDLLVQQVEKYI